MSRWGKLQLLAVSPDSKVRDELVAEEEQVLAWVLVLEAVIPELIKLLVSEKVQH